MYKYAFVSLQIARAELPNAVSFDLIAYSPRTERRGFTEISTVEHRIPKPRILSKYSSILVAVSFTSLDS